MREMGLKAKRRDKFKPRSTVVDDTAMISSELIGQDITAKQPQQDSEHFGNLPVRVAGSSQMFRLLDRPLQDHLIARTKHHACCLRRRTASAPLGSADPRSPCGCAGAGPGGQDRGRAG